MAVLTIGGKDFPAALNLRSARLFEERTEQSLYDIFSSFASDGDGLKLPDELKISASLITAAIWALANAKSAPDGKLAVAFEFVEESIGVDEIQGLVDQAKELIPKGLRGDPDSPLAIVTENESQPTG